MAAVDAGGSGSGSWSGALSLNNTALRHGAVYRFTLTLTNFLGHAADAAPFAVTVFGIPLPTLSIPGAPSLTVLLSESLVRFAQATPAACRVSVTNSTLRYRWEIHGTPGTAAAAVVIPTMTWNIAKDPRTLILPPAFVRANLRVGGVYTIIASVQDNAGSVNNASCTVAVVASPLEASVAGGDRAIGTTDALSLDGSASLDPDADWNNTDLRFSWRCSCLTPGFSATCGLTATAVLNQSVLALPAQALLPSRKYRFELTVVSPAAGSVGGSALSGALSGPLPSRSASACVDITVLQAVPPTVLASLAAGAGGKVNAGERLAVMATVLSAGARPVTCAWAQTAGNLDWGDGQASGAAGALLEASATFGAPTTVTITRAVWLAHAVQPVAVPLVLRANALTPGVDYAFRLACENADASGAVGFSSVAVRPNTPPSSGSLAVTPRIGVTLVDLYTMRAQGWLDDAADLPMQFRFAYLLGDIGGVDHTGSIDETRYQSELALTGAALSDGRYPQE
jgi:hypothetical protein